MNAEIKEIVQIVKAWMIGRLTDYEAVDQIRLILGLN